MGCTSAIVFTCFGAAYGTAKAGVGVSAMGVLRPDLIVKSTFPLSQAQADSVPDTPRVIQEFVGLG
jgi:V-type H+-transporting ATPase proteolipid subunit